MQSIWHKECLRVIERTFISGALFHSSSRIRCFSSSSKACSSKSSNTTTASSRIVPPMETFTCDVIRSVSIYFIDFVIFFDNVSIEISRLLLTLVCVIRTLRILLVCSLSEVDNLYFRSWKVYAGGQVCTI